MILPKSHWPIPKEELHELVPGAQVRLGFCLGQLATQPALFLRISETNNDSWWTNNSYVLVLTRLNSQGILCTSSDKVDDALLQAAGWKNKVFQAVVILTNHEKVGTCLNQTRRFPCCALSVLSTNETLSTHKLSRATKTKLGVGRIFTNDIWKE